MLVIDSSAVLGALAVERRDRALVERLGQATELHAPHVLDVEVLGALVGLVARDQLKAERAEYVREDFAAMRVRRYSHEMLADRAWTLQSHLGAADAMFVALAATLGAPLITCDPALEAMARPFVSTELYGSA